MSIKEINTFIQKKLRNYYESNVSDYFGILWDIYLLNYIYKNIELRYIKENNYEFVKLNTSKEKIIFYLSNNLNFDSSKIFDYFYSNYSNYKLSNIFLDEDKINKKKYSVLNNYFEYLYDYNKILEFKGKKLQKKRNLLNFYKKNYLLNSELVLVKNHSEFIRKNKNAILELVEKTSMLQEEKEIFFNYIKNILISTKCNFYCLLNKNKIIGITVNKIVNDVLYVIILNANKNFKGSFQYLLYASIKDNLNIKYVNLLDDNGKENLRKTKLQYRPIKITKKWYIKFNYLK